MVTFLPMNQTLSSEEPVKLLRAARLLKLDIRFGCAACRCGTCAVRVVSGKLSPMAQDETALLESMTLPTDGSIRLSCQARTLEGGGEVVIDLEFQNQYSPDEGLD